MTLRTAIFPLTVLCILAAACSEPGSPADPRAGDAAQTDDRTGFAEADLRILFLGNSHTSSHRLPQMIEAMLEKTGKFEDVFVAMNTDAFLANHVENPRTLKLLTDGPWDIVVLQAQKYSQSGKYTYPHDGAIKLTRLAHDGGAKVLMYPEWGQKGRDDEGERIHALHESIAKETGASVVPVGRAWDKALKEKPELVLHASDGNHSSPSGAYLTACVFACWIAETDVSRAGAVGAPRGLNTETRKFLQRVAWVTVEANRKSVER